MMSPAIVKALATARKDFLFCRARCSAIGNKVPSSRPRGLLLSLGVPPTY